MVHPSPDPAVQPDSDRMLGRLNLNPPGMTLRQLLREDYDTHERDLFAQGLWAIAVHRFGNWRMGIRNRLLRGACSLLYRMGAKIVQWLCGIDLKYTTQVGRRVRLWHQGGMQLGALAIGDDVHIRQNTTMGVRRHGDPRWMKPVIGPNCQINAGSVIVGPVVVGAGSVIGANVVLAQDVSPNSIVTVPKPNVRLRTH
ncbi:transferase [uncultured Sphingomonas sp.]|uniref:serine O-acetyltransferase n=1 Tax=uncultured Sphingomonas sp. TaxID=158754 RepID=UPI0025E832A4|nr:transferase [uncultured Sphingomonas sp.]